MWLKHKILTDTCVETSILIGSERLSPFGSYLTDTSVESGILISSQHLPPFATFHLIPPVLGL